MSLHRSQIDYIAQAGERIGRQGYVLNIVTGCQHHWSDICNIDCYARNMVLNGRLKGHKSYPYGFAPTFHPERVKKIGGVDKLIFTNDMGDPGGDWQTRYVHPNYFVKASPKGIASEMVNFALLNPNHIILLLTKNPSWYRLAEWPENVYCGFSASYNDEIIERWASTYNVPESRIWMSLEPWLDKEAPFLTHTDAWLVIGGLSGRNAKPVSVATLNWLMDASIQAKRFTKRNAYTAPKDAISLCFPREYPDEWRVTDAHSH